MTDHRGFGSFVSARRADYQAQLGMFVAMESHEGGNGAHASGVVHTCDCKHCSILGSCNDTLLGTMCRGELDAFHLNGLITRILLQERGKGRRSISRKRSCLSQYDTSLNNTHRAVVAAGAIMECVAGCVELWPRSPRWRMESAICTGHDANRPL